MRLDERWESEGAGGGGLLETYPLYHLPREPRALLDVGCNLGDTLGEAARRGVAWLRGVDINPAAVAEARSRLAGLGDVEVTHASADSLPFADGQFDAVTCLEVLEHVPAELRPEAIAEFRRVLRPGGRLILTVPHRGPFHFLDPENMRFHFPRLHARLAAALGGNGKEAGYQGQKHGVVYHHHFRLGEIRVLLGERFRVLRAVGRGFLLFPIGAWLRWPFYRRQNRDHIFCRAVERMMYIETHCLRLPVKLSYDVLVVAEAI